MARLQLGRFPMSKHGYIVAQFRITTLWCSIGAVPHLLKWLCSVVVKDYHALVLPRVCAKGYV